MKKIITVYILIIISSCSEKKTGTVEKGIYYDTIKKGDSVEIIPKIVEPADRTRSDSATPFE